MSEVGYFFAGLALGVVGTAVAVHYLSPSASGEVQRSLGKKLKRGDPGWYVIAYKDEREPGQPDSRRRIGYIDGPFYTRGTAAGALFHVPDYWYDPKVKHYGEVAAAQFR